MWPSNVDLNPDDRLLSISLTSPLRQRQYILFDSLQDVTAVIKLSTNFNYYSASVMPTLSKASHYFSEHFHFLIVLSELTVTNSYVPNHSTPVIPAS